MNSRTWGLVFALGCSIDHSGLVSSVDGDMDDGGPGLTDTVNQDTAIGDVGPVDDAGSDSGAIDSGRADSGAVDSGAVDSGAVDSGAVDSGAVDSGAVDSGPPDSGPRDAGPDIPACAPDGPSCVAGTYQVCSAGVVGESEVCLLDCHSAEPRCNDMAVSNANDDWLLLGTAPIDVATGQVVIFDTDTGEITRGAVMLRSPGTGIIDGIRFTVLDQGGTGVDIGVFSVLSMSIDEGGEVTARGESSLAILSAGEVVIAGVIDLGANAREAGPGGGRGGREGNGAGDGAGGYARRPGAAGGGGGAGHAAIGGQGGRESNRRGSGGDIIADPLGIPLVGGGGGGGGGETTGFTGADGGGGGGALQISSALSIRVTGTIRVPGDGGDEGKRAGGGGGAGGTILLEAPDIDLMGRAVANGGSGAAGLGGDDGARGGDDAQRTTGAGGDGGGGDQPGGVDGSDDPNESDLSDGAAGGGGAAGRVVIRAARASLAGVISPSFGSGSVEAVVGVR